MIRLAIFQCRGVFPLVFLPDISTYTCQYRHQLQPAISWWRHQMETFSALLVLCVGNSPVTGEFPTQRPVMQRFEVFFDLRLRKWLRKQSRRWWFKTPLRSLWRHSNVFGQLTCCTLRLGRCRTDVDPTLPRRTQLSYERLGISNHMCADSLFNSLFTEIQRRHQSSVLLTLCEGILMTAGSPHKWVPNAESAVRAWRHHVHETHTHNTFLVMDLPQIRVIACGGQDCYIACCTKGWLHAEISYRHQSNYHWSLLSL